MPSRQKLFLTAGTLGAGFAGWYIYRQYYSKYEASNALTPEEFSPFKLQSIQKYNHNTSIFRIAVNSSNLPNASLPVASFILVKDFVDGKEIIRPYTPITFDISSGYIELLIKRYPNGQMSSLIHSKKPGDSMLIKGPLKKFSYELNSKKSIGMIAGGTGITPMLQVIKKVLDNPLDKTKVSLLFANVSENDILLKDEFDRMSAANPDRFEVHYTIDKPSTEQVQWKEDIGIINESMIKRYMPQPGKDSLILVCGPPKMMQLVSGEKNKDLTQGEVSGILKNLGYSTENVFKY